MSNTRFKNKNNSAKVLAVLRSSRYGDIAGCVVTSGSIHADRPVTLVRNGEVIGSDLAITTMKYNLESRTHADEEQEFGVTLNFGGDIHEDDVIEQ
ncbi:hypothetical protein [Nocardioides nanhaiensis]|uniref:Uncharacterized protein n=1 Tax=Nocardioides nanhaiensis TaxID=1476871 RepID=A0ABP8WZW0_9ACTN